MKQKIGVLSLQKDGSYQDRYGHTVIVNKKKGIGYLVDESSLKKYRIFKERNMIPVVVLVAVVAIFDSLVLGFAIAVGVFVGFQMVYHQVFLPSLEQHQPIEIEGGTTLKDKLLQSSFLANVSRLALFLVILGSALYLLISFEHDEITYLIENYNTGFQVLLYFLLVLWSCYMICLEISVMITQRKQGKRY